VLIRHNQYDKPNMAHGVHPQVHLQFEVGGLKALYYCITKFL